MEGIDSIISILNRIYGGKNGKLAFEKIFPLIERFPAVKRKKQVYFSHQDTALITYGDTLNKRDEFPLNTLYKFVNKYFKDIFSTIHILPFCPFSSDDGFSVIDFLSVNSEFGSWDDIKVLGNDFKLMFDFVLNHVSAKSNWFEKYLKEEVGFKDLAIEVDPATDLSLIVRPRTIPIMTEFIKSSGESVYVWTTFSADQIDLNYRSLDVLKRMIEVLLFYVGQGASVIRLDAIAYLWKEIGTTCINLSQTHDFVQLFRKILDLVAPDAIIIAETNLPHNENISYLGDGQNEAQLIYNFTLPPLLLYSFIKEDSTRLSHCAKGLSLKSKNTTFLNFTASHDGIGLRPLEGILSNIEVNQLIETVKENGGYVSYRKNSDGQKIPYELNITYIDALLNKKTKNDPYHTRRFLASQAIQLALPGVPAIYIHSILGSRNWKRGVEHTHRVRTINRKKLQVDNILSQIKNPESFGSKIFYPYIDLIKIRKKQKVFHPNCPFEIMDLHPKLFGIARYNENHKIYALTNISSQAIHVSLAIDKVSSRMKDLVTGKVFDANSLIIDPYQFLWLSNTYS